MWHIFLWSEQTGRMTVSKGSFLSHSLCFLSIPGDLMRVFCSSLCVAQPPVWPQTYKIGCSEMTPPSPQHLLYQCHYPVRQQGEQARETGEWSERDTSLEDTTPFLKYENTIKYNKKTPKKQINIKDICVFVCALGYVCVTVCVSGIRPLQTGLLEADLHCSTVATKHWGNGSSC